MNDLTALNDLQSSGKLSGGQLIAYYGKGVVSNLISGMEDYMQAPAGLPVDGPSHVGFVLRPGIPVNGQVQTEPYTIESSITTDPVTSKQISGPQINRLRWRVQHYDQDARIYIIEWRARVSAMIDWDLAWKTMIERVGVDSYAKGQLFDFILRKLPVVGNIPEVWEAHKSSEVCSVFCGMGIHAGGFPGLRPELLTPSWWVSAAMWSDCWQICGPKQDIRGFNLI